MLQASSVYKICKQKHSVAYGNYSGSGGVGSVRSGPVRLTCDYKAISVQLQLQLPAGTELYNIFLFRLSSLIASHGKYGKLAAS